MHAHAFTCARHAFATFATIAHFQSLPMKAPPASLARMQCISTLCVLQRHSKPLGSCGREGARVERSAQSLGRGSNAERTQLRCQRPSGACAQGGQEGAKKGKEATAEGPEEAEQAEHCTAGWRRARTRCRFCDSQMFSSTLPFFACLQGL